MKILITFLFINFSFNFIQAQIKWNEKRPLTWKDFSGVVDFKSIHYANTATSTNYQYHVHYHNNIYSLTFEVECLFLPSDSWCKPYKQTNALLSHEQLHFDIQELFARKLMAAFKAKSYTANYEIEVRNIYEVIAQEAKSIQKKYDKETDYSEMRKEQLKWERWVRELLKIDNLINPSFKIESIADLF